MESFQIAAFDSLVDSYCAGGVADNCCGAAVFLQETGCAGAVLSGVCAGTACVVWSA